MAIPTIFIPSLRYTVPVNFIVEDLRQAFDYVTRYCRVDPFQFAELPPCSEFALEPVDRLGLISASQNRQELASRINDALATNNWFFNQFYIQAPPTCNSYQLDQYFHQIPGTKKFVSDGGQNAGRINPLGLVD